MNRIDFPFDRRRRRRNILSLQVSTNEGRVEGELTGMAVAAALFRFMELDMMYDREIGNRARRWW